MPKQFNMTDAPPREGAGDGITLDSVTIRWQHDESPDISHFGEYNGERQSFSVDRRKGILLGELLDSREIVRRWFATMSPNTGKSCVWKPKSLAVPLKS